MTRAIGLLGVPSSAGAHWPGQEKAPHALREIGLVDELRNRGLEVVDYGDLPVERYKPDGEHRHAQSAGRVARVARLVAERVEGILRDGMLPLVIGGDCSIGVGVTSGFVRHYGDAALLYFDGHPDLNTPLTSASGILDAMGLAHLLGERGVIEEIATLGPRVPLLTPDKVVIFGYNPRSIDAAERESIERNRLAAYSLDVVRVDATAAAQGAVALIGAAAGVFSVHFDVDVVEFSDLPLANVAQFHRALPFDDAVAALQQFTASPKFGGLTIAEVNPDHDDEERSAARKLVRAIADALAKEER